jgi:hypothetical protein
MRCFRDLAIAACWSVVVLVLLEFGLRASGAKYAGSFYEPDATRYATFRPNAQGWDVEGENYCRFNSLGMRDRERTVAKAPGTFRIAVFGDSTTAASETALENTMTQVAERILSREAARAGKKVEVLNFGVGGYTLAQVYLYLRDKAWDFQPDAVMVFTTSLSIQSAVRSLNTLRGPTPYFVYRDGKLAQDPSYRAPGGTDRASLRRSGAIKDVYNRVFLAQLGMTAWQSGVPAVLAKLHRSAPAVRPSTTEYMIPFRHNLTPDGEEAWHVAEGLVALMSEESRRHGAEFWLVNHAEPHQCEIDPAERESFLKSIGEADLNYTDDRWRDFAAQNGIHFFAMAPGMYEYAMRHQTLLFGFPTSSQRNHGHLNRAGNEAAGEILAAKLLERSPALRAAF